MESTQKNSKGDRISGLDLARCIAFCGMVIVNYRVLSGWLLKGPVWLSDIASFFTGRAAATFVILAGAGMMLLYQAMRDRQPSMGAAPAVRHIAFCVVMALGVILIGFNADMAHQGLTPTPFPDLVAATASSPSDVCDGLSSRWSAYFERVFEGTLSTYFMICTGILLASIIGFFAVRPRFAAQWAFFNRSLFLFGFGYVWYPYWSGDILHFYGLYLLLGSLVVGLRSRWLILMGVATVIIGLCLQYQFDFQEGWRGYEYVRTDFWSLKGGLRNLFFNGWHPFFPWFAFLLTGMLLVRLNIRLRRVQLALILVGAILFVAAEESAPIAQTAVDIQITSAFESNSTSAPAMPNNNGKRTTLGEGISRKAHAPQIRASSRLLRALRRKPITGMEDSRPAGLEGYKAHIALDADGRSVCHIRADLQPESDQATASVAHVSWIVGQMQALPKKTMWGNDNGWPVEAQYIQLHVESADEAPPLQTAIPLEDAKSQVGWRRLRQALDSSSDKPGVFYILSATGTALIVIGLSLLFCSFGFGERLRRPIIHAGQCALTLYVGHILVGWTIIDILDKSSEQTLAFVLTACVICWWIGISFAALWRSIFRRGPLEMFMRSIT